MGNLSDVAQIVVSTAGSPVTRVGFGTPLIADSCLFWGGSNDRVRTYATPEDVIADGATENDAVVKSARSLKRSNPSPVNFKVGRRANRPMMQWTLVPFPQDNYRYILIIDDIHTVTFTSGSGATLASVITGLKAQIDSLALPLTVANVGPDTSMTITANAAGGWHSVRPINPKVPRGIAPNILIQQTHVDPGIADDLDAISAEDEDWYGLLLTTEGKAELLSAAAWIESQPEDTPHEFFAETQDSDCLTASTTDFLSSIEALDYKRTSGFHYPDNGAFLAPAIVGARLPTDPGSENWMFTPAAGIIGVAYTADQKNHLNLKNGNYFYTVGNKSFLAKGKVANGQWIDVVRFLDWLQINMAEDLLQLQIDMAAQGKKIPFDDAGITSVQNVFLARLKRGIVLGGLAPLPAPVVNVPLAASLAPEDVAARRLVGVTFSATLAGAIDTVSVSGVVI